MQIQNVPKHIQGPRVSLASLTPPRGDNYMKPQPTDMKYHKGKENNLTALSPLTLETLTMLPKMRKIPNELP